MKKIWITGCSGSGKTTLARNLSEQLNIPVFHRDLITWMGNWQMRPEDDQIDLLKEMCKNDSWIFDGNKYTASKVDGRYQTCDVLIHLETNRFVCLYRVIARFFKHRNHSREDLPEGCAEDLDLQHLKYVLIDYPKGKSKREKFFKVLETERKIPVLRNLSEVKRWLNDNDIGV